MSTNLNRLVLVLNSSYEAVSITSARHALTLMFKGSAVVEDVSTHIVHTSKIDIPVPNVIRLVNYRRVPRLTRSVSRKGILLRDDHQCSYCGKKLPVGELTLDHVIPRSKGGANIWLNLTTCCFPCNNKKRDRTPQEAGMELLRQPRELSRHAKHRLMQADESSWDKFLF